MRIISQNGEINLPYDLTAIFASGNRVQAVFSGRDQKSPYLMAMYSDNDKCREAMNIMKSTGIGQYFKDFIESGIVKVGAIETIFRFPKDDEV